MLTLPFVPCSSLQVLASRISFLAAVGTRDDAVEVLVPAIPLEQLLCVVGQSKILSTFALCRSLLVLLNSNGLIEVYQLQRTLPVI